jgi:hypothetical protein
VDGTEEGGSVDRFWGWLGSARRGSGALVQPALPASQKRIAHKGEWVAYFVSAKGSHSLLHVRSL